jgi:D-alanyl-D-alanine carboxypeptidase/D-alanyl-D-alanine-endopeptidase (penicillin-binding protein 4)
MKLISYGCAIILCVFLSLTSLAWADETIIKKTPAAALSYQVIKEAPQAGLTDSLSALLKKYKVPPDNLSVYVRDVNADQAMLSHNIDIVRSPASTIKLVTTFAALQQLGPNHAWSTEAWTRGKLTKGVLEGDLILKGYGDPFLVYERFWKLVNELRDRGLREVQGDIIIDETHYDLPEHDRKAFDGQSFRVYNAGASPLMFNFQATRLWLAPPENESENKIKLALYPINDTVKIDNKLKIVKGRCKRSHGRPKLSWGPEKQLIVSGSFSRECKPRFLMRLISAPNQLAFDAFKQFWLGLGGTLGGRLKTGQVEKKDELFHTYASPTLGEQIRLINKWSNNVMTRQLFLATGVNRYGSPATLKKGRDATIDVLQRHGVDTNGLIIENGSGLSRKSRISARQMAQLLGAAFRDAYMPEFMSSLSLAGIDGTLATRFRNEDLAGRSHLKTGTLNRVTAIAGYMLNRKGRRLIVVIQQNGAKVAKGADIQNEILRWAFEQ